MGFTTFPLLQKQINLERVRMLLSLFISKERSDFTDICPFNFETCLYV